MDLWKMILWVKKICKNFWYQWNQISSFIVLSYLVLYVTFDCLGIYEKKEKHWDRIIV